MKLFPCAGLLLLCCALQAGPVPAGDWETLEPDRLPAPWAELLERLREPESVYARFVERRVFSFRAEPLVLQGELRMDRRHGLSLHYIEPEVQTVIVDDQGVLLRDASRRTRSAPGSAVESTRPLRDVLRLDLKALANGFRLQGRRSENGWELQFAPRSGDGHGSAGKIHLSGTAEQVQRITVEPTARRRVEIDLSHVTPDATFAPAEVQRFFR